MPEKTRTNQTMSAQTTARHVLNEPTTWEVSQTLDDQWTESWMSSILAEMVDDPYEVGKMTTDASCDGPSHGHVDVWS